MIKNFFLIMLILFMSCNTTKTTVKPEMAIVDNQLGIVITENKDSKSKTVAAVPYKAIITILIKEKVKTVTIRNGQQAFTFSYQWKKIKWKNFIGWTQDSLERQKIQDFKEPTFTEEQKKLISFIRNGFIQIDNINSQWLQKKFGQPSQRRVIKITNQYSHKLDDYITYYYPNIEISFLSQSNPDKILVRQISFAANNHKLLFNIKIGMSKVEIKKIFGSPTNFSQNKYTFISPEYLHDQILFYFTKNSLEKILWIFNSG